MAVDNEPSEDLDLSSTQPSDWSYVQEGGANVVLRYTGLSPSPLSRYIIRLRKKGLRQPTEDADFIDTVVSRLLPFPLSARSMLVDVPSAEWLDQLAKRVEEQALSSGTNRLGGGIVETQTSHVTLVEDMIGTDGISIEIKVGHRISPMSHFLTTKQSTHSPNGASSLRHPASRPSPGRSSALTVASACIATTSCSQNSLSRVRRSTAPRSTH
jgi:hypothetical protein